MRHIDVSKEKKTTYIVTGMDDAGQPTIRARKRSVFLRGIVFVLSFGMTASVAMLAGFIVFSKLIHEESAADIAGADAIVVLTGGEARIPEAVKLLAQGKGRRLLISGVNPTTTRRQLASLTPNSQKWYRCCIDVDHAARDTIGNANETRAWVEKRGFKSLIVVTASYHMPRSLAELRRALPDTQFIPYPVKPGNFDPASWWTNPATFRFLAMEYAKFLPALGRCVIIQIGLNRGIFGGVRQCLNSSASS